MEALLTSTVVVALAEVGDKTQLLAIVLATRFKRPWPIIGGIFAATIANHFLAALVGAEMSSFLDGRWFRYVVARSDEHTSELQSLLRISYAVFCLRTDTVRK